MVFGHWESSVDYVDEAYILDLRCNTDIVAVRKDKVGRNEARALSCDVDQLSSSLRPELFRTGLKDMGLKVNLFVIAAFVDI